MRFRFGSCQLDPDRFELLRDGRRVAVEPQAFQLLLLLIRHRDRMVSKDEIVEAVWHGHAVSDASISSRVSMARNVIGDDGERQAFIRTVHGRGFCFVAAVTEEVEPAPSSVAISSVEAADTDRTSAGKPSIAILPLQALGLPSERRVIADAISHDVIQAMSRLRWLSVIARGSAFRFRETEPDVIAVGAALNVSYLLFGVAEALGSNFSATLELADCASGAIVWADRLVAATNAVQELRSRIVTHLVGALEVYIPLNEAMAAKLSTTDQLDAWASYHLGLHHMYRFNAADNAQATALFERAVRLDPKFARAFAGLSFTRFQDAFMRYVEPKAAALAARSYAERGLELDPLDPFVNFNMGRSFWLTDEPDAAGLWLDRAIELNPNYAQGFYSRAFTAMLVGDHDGVAADADTALRLSPFDPMLYGMLGVRAFALIQAGRHDEAADWSDRAAAAPGAHFLIAMVALIANDLADRPHRAQHWLDNIRSRRPDATARHFFTAFPLHDPASKQLMEVVLEKYGF